MSKQIRLAVKSVVLMAAVAGAGLATASVGLAEKTATTNEAGHGHHIRIRTAISYLRDAKWDLAHVDKDFAGYNPDTLKEIENALKEAHAAIGVVPDPDPKDAPDVVKQKLDETGAEHPLLAHAVHSLDIAVKELDGAEGSFEDHKHEAIAATSRAIHQINDSIEKAQVERAAKRDGVDKLNASQRVVLAKADLTNVLGNLKTLQIPKGEFKDRAAKFVEDAIKQLDEFKPEK